MDGHTVRNICRQGCGNTMPVLVRPGPISFRTSLKFLFTCPGTILNKFTILYFIFGNYYEVSTHMCRKQC